MGNVEPGQDFLPVLHFPPVSIIPPLFHTVAQPPVSFKWSIVSIPGHYACDLWWEMLNRDRIFSQYFTFPLSVSYHHCSKLIHSSITEVTCSILLTESPYETFHQIPSNSALRADSYWQIQTVTDMHWQSQALMIRKFKNQNNIKYLISYFACSCVTCTTNRPVPTCLSSVGSLVSVLHCIRSFQEL